MKKTLIIIIAIVIILVMWGVLANNSLIKLEESIKQEQAEIENQLKRRSDLIPNLVNTVKGLTTQEQKIVESITSARANMIQGDTQSKLNANEELTKNINILVENYPEIKSDSAFTGLMDELAGTENRIAIARKNYNDRVADFNKTIKTFPSVIIANMFDHTEKQYLEVTQEDQEFPNVNF